MKRALCVVATLVGVAQAILAGGLRRPDPSIGQIGDWHRTSNRVRVQDNLLYLDALSRGEPFVAGFVRDEPFADVTLAARFKVESLGPGARAFGLIFGSTDGQTYHFVEVSRRDAVLGRAEPGKPSIPLRREGALRLREGEWYTVRVEVTGMRIQAWVAGELLEVNSPQLKPGLVGVYAREARAWVQRLGRKGTRTRLTQAWTLRREEEEEEKKKGEEGDAPAPTTAAPAAAKKE